MTSIVTPSEILEFVAKGIKVSGAKRFTVDIASLKEANIGCTGTNFNQHFFGKVEKNVKNAILAVHCLKKPTTNTQIRKEIGQEREVIALVHFFNLLKKQSREKYHLLVNGYANIAHIRDKNEDPLAVHAYWFPDDHCWGVSAYLVKDSFACLADRVFFLDC